MSKAMMSRRGFGALLITGMLGAALTRKAYAHDEGGDSGSGDSSDSSEQYFERLGSEEHKLTDHTYQNHYHIEPSEGGGGSGGGKGKKRPGGGGGHRRGPRKKGCNAHSVAPSCEA